MHQRRPLASAAHRTKGKNGKLRDWELACWCALLLSGAAGLDVWREWGHSPLHVPSPLLLSWKGRWEEGRGQGRTSIGGAVAPPRREHGDSQSTDGRGPAGSLLDSVSPGHKGPVSDFSNVVPLFLRPSPSMSNSESTSFEKPLGSKVSHTRYYSLCCAFGLYVSLIFALNSSCFCTRWSLPVAERLIEQRPCLRLCIFGCSLKMDVSHTCADGGGITATARGPVSHWADSHFSLLPVSPLVTSSCVETYKDDVCTWHVQHMLTITCQQHVDNPCDNL